jgi:hypothetical protein
MKDQNDNSWPQANNQPNTKKKDAFPSEDKQKAAAEKTEMNYNHSYRESYQDTVENGAVAANMGPHANDEAHNNNNASGRGFTTASNIPGPGTATDRGRGRIGSTSFGNGVDAPGMSGDIEEAGGYNDQPGNKPVGVGAPGDAKNLKDSRPKDWDISRDASTTSRDDPDTAYGGGAADDDTSAGYGLGEATGNSSASDTGLGLGGSTDPRGGSGQRATQSGS